MKFQKRCCGTAARSLAVTRALPCLRHAECAGDEPSRAERCLSVLYVWGSGLVPTTVRSVVVQGRHGACKVWG